MNKKVVVIGGGTGMSNLLRGLKQFPLDITSIVTVCDDGKSTGILREEFNIPAVGDIRRVLVALSETEPLVMDLFNYRFKTSSDLDGHTVGNLLLTASTEITGNLSDGIEALSKVLNLKGQVVPLTEDNVTLMAELLDGTIIEGEHNITLRKEKSKINKVYYKEKAIVNKKALKAIKEADLIVFSMGSLFTSIIPNLLIDDIVKEIEKSKAKLMYVSNMMTQPGETDDFTVSDHIKKLNEYLGNRKIDIVLANTGKIDEEMAKFYETEEQKDPVACDLENLKDVEVITDDFTYITDNNLLRHDRIKLGFHIFYYLMKK